MHVAFLAPIRATCPAHHTFLDLITRMISDLTAHLCSFLNPPVTPPY